MIYTDAQLKEKIVRMLASFENEVVEFKEARSNYHFNDIGKYFSALSNEANLRGLQEAWLIFGISDDKKIVGTDFRKQGGLQNLKKEIVNGTNERLTFMEIYILNLEKCRVIAFQIPPAIRGIPTTWQGAAYAREHESISPLPMNKVDLIRSQIGMDWSKEIVENATFEDLDKEAVKKARELFKDAEYPLPLNTPKFLGYTINDFNLSNGQPTKAFAELMDKIASIVEEILIPNLEKENMLLTDDKYSSSALLNNKLRSIRNPLSKYCIAEISNFNKLIALSNEKSIPIYELRYTGLQSGQQKTLHWFNSLFTIIAQKITTLANE